MNARVAMGVTVDTHTIRVGDQLLIAGQAFTVEDMTALPRNAKRLHFTSGESFTMQAHTVLYATRAIRPGTTGARSGRRLPHPL